MIVVHDPACGSGGMCSEPHVVRSNVVLVIRRMLKEAQADCDRIIFKIDDHAFNLRSVTDSDELFEDVKVQAKQAAVEEHARLVVEYMQKIYPPQGPPVDHHRASH